MEQFQAISAPLPTKRCAKLRTDIVAPSADTESNDFGETGRTITSWNAGLKLNKWFGLAATMILFGFAGAYAASGY